MKHLNKSKIIAQLQYNINIENIKYELKKMIIRLIKECGMVR